MSLSACAFGEGYYGDGYVNGAGYGCDPYAPFDDYYACDNGHGYANIGFGGGWYDNYYYPGYGFHIFDHRGSRHAMQQNHRRYWARQRADYRTRHGRRSERRAERRRNLTPEQRAERRERRAERRAEAGYEGRREARRNGTRRKDNVTRNDRRRRGAGQSGRTRAAVPSVNVAPRAGRNTNTQTGNRPRSRPNRPTIAAQQPQRARPAARVARPAPPPRPTVRHSPRTPRADRRDVSDQ